jgi:HAD superfamily hydrolase (TIGR01509 family)
MRTNRKRSSSPEALVFDFDGVIADTEPSYWRAWSELLSTYQVSLSWADYCRIGRGIRDEKMLEALAVLAADPDLVTRVQSRLPERREMIRQWNLDQPPISPATVELLKSLHGRKLGLVTSSDRIEVEPMLQKAGIAECFNAFVFGDEVQSHKPDPAPYLLIRQKLAVRGGIVFEDSEAGLLSARSAEFKTILVPSPADLSTLVWKVLKNDR